MDIILSLFRDVNFDFLLQYLWLVQLVGVALAIYFGLFTLSLAVWVYRDIHNRTREPLIIAFFILMVLLLNIPGLILYLFLRPSETLAENYERSLHEEALLRELDDQISCPTCHRPVQPDFILCPFCSTQLKRSCPSCQKALGASWRSCPYCGIRLPEQASPAGVKV